MGDDISQHGGPEGDLPRLAFVVANLPGRKAQRFHLRPDAAQRQAMAAALDLLDLPAFDFVGEILPEGRHDFRLRADLAAAAVLACSVTLAPVPAELRERIDRLYQRAAPQPEGDEVEVPQEDVEDLPEVLDITAIALEALELALPLYPRAEGAELGEAVFAGAGVEPLSQEALRPFAGLAALAAQLAQQGDKTGGNGGEKK